MNNGAAKMFSKKNFITLILYITLWLFSVVLIAYAFAMLGITSENLTLKKLGAMMTILVSSGVASRAYKKIIRILV